jgi:hypothetical protein
MKAKGFTTTILVDQTPEQAFDAISDVRGWWTGEIEGATDRLGAAFTYRYQKLHRTTQQVAELVRGRRIVWRVTDSHIDFLRDEREWTGAEIVFELARRGDQTEVRFIHVGLVPALECYDACTGGWGFYVNESLRAFIAAREGGPRPAGRRRSQARGRGAQIHAPGSRR